MRFASDNAKCLGTFPSRDEKGKSAFRRFLRLTLIHTRPYGHARPRPRPTPPSASPLVSLRLTLALALRHPPRPRSNPNFTVTLTLTRLQAIYAYCGPLPGCRCPVGCPNFLPAAPSARLWPSESGRSSNARVARCLLHPGVCRQLLPRPNVTAAARRGFLHAALLLRAPALQVRKPDAVVDEGLCEAALFGAPRTQHGDAREHHGVALHRHRDVHARDRPPVRYHLASRPRTRRAGPVWKTAVHRLGPKLPPARPAGARQSSGRPPTSGSLGKIADSLWPSPTGLHFSTQALVFTKHFAVQLYTCFEYRSFIAQNYGHLGNHLAFVICASMPGRILRCFARPASTLKVCLEVPGLLYALAPRELTATAQTRKLPQEVLPLKLASVAHSPLRTCRVGLQRCALLAVCPAVAPRVSTCVDTLPACSRAARAHVCSRRPHAFSIDAPSHAAGQPWVGPGKPSARAAPESSYVPEAEGGSRRTQGRG